MRSVISVSAMVVCVYASCAWANSYSLQLLQPQDHIPIKIVTAKRGMTFRSGGIWDKRSSPLDRQEKRGMTFRSGGLWDKRSPAEVFQVQRRGMTFRSGGLWDKRSSLPEESKRGMTFRSGGIWDKKKRQLATAVDSQQPSEGQPTYVGLVFDDHNNLEHTLRALHTRQ